MFFREMKYVYEVYRHRSFSKAAQALFIAQSSLSQMVKKAETRIGGSIFDRSTTPISLTELGRVYIQAAEKIIQIEDDFEQYLTDAEECPTGVLAIGGTALFTSYVLPPILSAFSARYPGVEIRLHEQPTSMLKKELLDGTLDLAMDNATLEPASFESVVYQPEEIVLALPRKTAEEVPFRRFRMTASYIQRGGIQGAASVPLKLLSGMSFVLLKEGCDTRTRANKLCEEAGFVPRVRLQVDQQMAAYNMAAQGMGAAFISDTLVKNVPHDDRLMFLRLSGEAACRNICFYYKRNRAVSVPTAAFLKMMKSYKNPLED